MLNPVKFHTINIVTPRSGAISKQTLLEYIVQMFQSMPEQDVPGEMNRLIKTGQIIENSDGFIEIGKVIFEDGETVSPNAEAAAKEILENLKDRRGLRQEIEHFDDDVVEELINTIASIIDKNRK